jgi:hypothetical protein
MNQELDVSRPDHQLLVQSIVSRVLLILEPSGAELELGYIQPLIELASKNEVIEADLWDEAGRFGNADLLGPLVVPLVVFALASANGRRAAVTSEDVKRMVLRIRSSQGRRRMQEIEQAINTALAASVSSTPAVNERRQGD